MNKIFFIIFFIAVFCRCTKSITGFYSSWYTMELKKDSSFFFTSGGESNYSYSKGKYKKIDKNTISLQSDILDKSIFPHIKEGTDILLKDSIKFEINMIVSGNNKNLYNYEIIINDTFKILKNGFVDNFYLQKIKVEKLRIRVFGEERWSPSAARDTLSSSTLFLQNLKSNLIQATFSVDYKLFNFRIFNNYSIKYYRNNLLIDNFYLLRTNGKPFIREGTY